MDAETRLDAAVGSVAEEATRLLEALGRPSAPSRDEPNGQSGQSGLEHGDTAAATDHVHVAMGEAETCTWCPVCRSVGVLRSVSPETLGRLADLATAAATVLAELATRHTDDPPGERREGADRTTRTEPITVVDEEELS